MHNSHTARLVFAGALLLGIAGAVGACSDPPPPTTTTTVERTTTVTPVQPPTTITRTHVQQTP